MTQKFADKLTKSCLIILEVKSILILIVNFKVKCDWLMFLHDGLEAKLMKIILNNICKLMFYRHLD